MPNYNETNVSGTEYSRCYEISIINPLDLTPIVQFKEEKVTNLGDRTFKEMSRIIGVPFDPAKVITLLDSTTGIPTGSTITMGEVYEIMYSAYIQEATALDNQV